MEANRPDQHLHKGVANPLAALDQRLIDALCALALESGRKDGAPPVKPQAEEKKEEKGEKKSSAWLAQLGSIVLALLVTGTAVLGLLGYKQLGDEMGKNRREASELRRELGKFRTHFVRKDEFSSRNLAAHAMIQDTDAKSKAALDFFKDRLQEHKLTLRDASQQVKGLQLDAKRFADRLAAREKREGVVPSAAPGKQPNGQ